MRGVIYLTAILATAAQAQIQSDVQFDAASVKPSNTLGSKVSSTRLTPGEVTLENASLRKCIALAYGIQEDRDYALSGPDWLNFEAFDIVAKFPPATPIEQVRLMLQALLADRFQLKIHRETKESPVYALVVAKNGPKLQPADPASRGQFSMGPGRFTAQAAPMSGFADRLSSRVFQLGRPVVDRTGLTGVYDFTLEWTPDSVAPEDASGPSIFTALQEQLGLKLEAQKAPVETLVVDHAERVPAEN